MLLELLSRAVQHDGLMRLASPLFGAWHPFRASYRRDPYPAYARLRQRAPRHYTRLLQSWVFSRYDDVAELMAHPDASVARGESDLFKKYAPLDGADDRLKDTLFRSLLMLDPPDHTRIRRLVNRAFTPAAVDGVSDRVRELVDRHVHAIEPGQRFDLLEGVAVPLPVVVICEWLGVPTDRLADLKRWSELLTQLLDPISALNAIRNSQYAIGELAEYFDALFEQRRQHPENDLLTALVQAEDEGERLTNAELTSLVALLLAAGHETTTNLIANSVLALEHEPELRRRLIEDPSCVESAVEELLRFDSPVQLTDRMAKRDIVLGSGSESVTIRKGVMAVLIFGSANRDPDIFENPDTIDFDRQNARHLSFGHGVHFCIGAALARLEARLLLPPLFEALGDYRIDRSTIDWKRSVVLRGPTELRLQTGSRRSKPAHVA